MNVDPYLAFKGNCSEAIEFYRNAPGATVLFSQTFGESPMANMGPAENIMHCSIRIGDSTLMMCDDLRSEAALLDGNVSLAIGLSDPEHAKTLFANLAQGGRTIMPLQKTYWAEAFGMVTDKFGVKWMVNCGSQNNVVP